MSTIEAATLEAIYTASDEEFVRVSNRVESRLKKSANVAEQTLKEHQRSVEKFQRDQAQAFENLFGRVPGSSQVNRFKSVLDDLKTVTRTAEGGGEAIGSVGLAGIGAAAGVGVFVAGIGAASYAVAKSVSIFSDYAGKIHDIGQESGLTAGTLSTVDVYARLAGSSVEQAANAFTIYLRNASEAANGNEAMAKTFKRFGIDATEALKDPDRAVQDLLDALAKIPNAAERLDAANKLAGRSGKLLASIAAEMGGSFAEAKRQAEEWGVVLSEDDVKAADRLGDSMEILKQKAAGAIYSIAREVMPELTKALGDVDSALSTDRSMWEKWGSGAAVEIARVRGVMQGFADWWHGNTWNPWEMGKALERGRDRAQDEFMHGYGERHGYFDLNRPATGEQQKRGEEERRRALAEMDTARGGGAGSYAVEQSVSHAKSKAETARKRFVDTLQEWADAFNIPRSALREIGSQSKVHRGWAHRSGMAADINPELMTPEAIDGARRMGLNVLPELYKGDGPNGFSTGPHYHIQAMTKGTKAAGDVLRAQDEVIKRLGETVAEVTLRVQNFGRTEIDQAVAAERLKQGVDKLTGARRTETEWLLSNYRAELEAEAAKKKHAEATQQLAAISSSLSEELFGEHTAVAEVTKALTAAGVPLGSYIGQWERMKALLKDVGEAKPFIDDMPKIPEVKLPDGPSVTPDGSVAPHNVFEDRLRKAQQMREVGEDVANIFGDVTSRIGDDWEGMWAEMLNVARRTLQDISQELSRMALTGQQSGAGGIIGLAVNWIGGALLGGLLAGGLPSAHGGSSGIGASMLKPSAPVNFGGGRAKGGPVTAGTVYPIHEEGLPEYFRPDVGGEVIPLSKMKAGSGGDYIDNRRYISIQIPPSRAASTFRSKRGTRETAEDLLSFLR